MTSQPQPYGDPRVDRLQDGVCPQCGKRRYPTRRHARRAAWLLYPTDRRLRPYPCSEGFWHLGHQRARPRRSRS